MSTCPAYDSIVIVVRSIEQGHYENEPQSCAVYKDQPRKYILCDDGEYVLRYDGDVEQNERNRQGLFQFLPRTL